MVARDRGIVVVVWCSVSILFVFSFYLVVGAVLVSREGWESGQAKKAGQSRAGQRARLVARNPPLVSSLRWCSSSRRCPLVSCRSSTTVVVQSWKIVGALQVRQVVDRASACKNGGWIRRCELDLDLDLELELKAQCRSSRDRIRLALVAGSPQLTPHPSPPHPSLVTSCSLVSSSSFLRHLRVCAAVQFRRRLFFFFFFLHVSCSSFRFRGVVSVFFLSFPSFSHLLRSQFFLVSQAEACSSRRRLTPHPTTSASLRFMRALLRLLQFFPQPSADPLKQTLLSS